MSVAACAALVERGDRDRFLATMAAPPAARRVLFPLYAFNLEVARAPWVTEEAMIAEMRLQWWRDALEEIASGGTVRRHEVVTPLAEVLDAEGAWLLDHLVAARRWDIYRDPFEDRAAFDAYIEDTAATLSWVAARALGSTAEKAVRARGWAAGLAAFFVAIPALEARGRRPLVDGRAEAVAGLAREALRKADEGRADRAGRIALLAGWQARGILRRAAVAPERVVEGRLLSPEFARKASLLMRSFL